VLLPTSSCTSLGLDQDFKFNDSGEDGKTLSSFHIDPATIKQVVDKFSKIIQSGKPVILDGRTTIRVCVYEPPKGTQQSRIPQFVGSGHGHPDCSCGVFC
jgi:hypothetical protein